MKIHKYIPPELENDKEVVLKAVKQNGEALSEASLDLIDDKEVVLAAVKQNGKALQHAPIYLRNDKDVVLASVTQNGKALRYAFGMKKDRDVVLAAVKQNGKALIYASDELKKDKQLQLEAVKQDIFQNLHWNCTSAEWIIATLALNITDRFRYHPHCDHSIDLDWNGWNGKHCEQPMEINHFPS